MWHTEKKVTGSPIALDRSELSGVLAVIEYTSDIAMWKRIYPNVQVNYDNEDVVKFSPTLKLDKTPTWPYRHNIDLK